MLFLEEIQKNFYEEVTSIIRYLNCIESNFIITNRNFIEDYFEKPDQEKLISEFDLFKNAQRIQKRNQDIIILIKNKINSIIEEKKKHLSVLPRFKTGVTKSKNYLKEIKKQCDIDFEAYLMEEPRDEDNFIKYLESYSAEKLKKLIDDDCITGSYKIPCIQLNEYKKILKSINKIALYNEKCKIDSEIYQLSNILALYSVFDNKDSINIYRQSIILLVATFEATITDSLKIIYSNNFIRYVEKLCKDDKILYSDISKSACLDDLKMITVCNDLNKKKFRAILYEMKTYDNKIFIIENRNVFVEIIETIKRRNLHIHNKGIVDDEYLEINKDGKSCFNPDNLEKGTYAVIDYKYFYRKCILLTDLIKKLSNYLEY